MVWRRMEVDEQRIRFVLAASEAGRDMRALCAAYGISRPTGYLWAKRFGAGGVAGVASQSRRPQSSPRRTALAVEERLVALRELRPDWGARKLAVLLEREGVTIPPATVHRILLRRGLVRVEDRHAPALRRFEREHPNQLWQMDFKSPKGWNRPVGPLSVLDDASRYAIALDGTWTTRGEAVRERLSAAFTRCGMPEAMLMDHGIPWWSASSSGGWTRLSVWLMKLGIRVYLSGVRHPQTQGKVERFHGSLEEARRKRGLPAAELQQGWLDAFRVEYNEVRPHEALGMKTPASLWRASETAFPKDLPEWVYPADSEVLRLGKTRQLTLHGRRWQVAGPLAEEEVRLERIGQRVLVFYRNTLVRELDLAGQGSTRVDPWPAKRNTSV